MIRDVSHKRNPESVTQRRAAEFWCHLVESVRHLCVCVDVVALTGCCLKTMRVACSAWRSSGRPSMTSSTRPEKTSKAKKDAPVILIHHQILCLFFSLWWSCKAVQTGTAAPESMLLSPTNPPDQLASQWGFGCVGYVCLYWATCSFWSSALNYRCVFSITCVLVCVCWQFFFLLLLFVAFLGPGLPCVISSTMRRKWRRTKKRWRAYPLIRRNSLCVGTFPQKYFYNM